MATVKCTNTDHLEVTFKVTDLDNYANKYDKFVWHFYQTIGSKTTEIMRYTYDWNYELSDANNFELIFSNSNYLGNNCFSPSTTYTLVLDCYWNGEAYSLPSLEFTTDSIAPPSYYSIQPVRYPMIRDQDDVDNCVAHCLSIIMEIFQYNNTGVVENYSISYIFGSDGDSDINGMYFENAVDNCKSHGSPRWELVAGSYPDNIYKPEAVKIFDSADSVTNSNASNQRFSNYKNIDFYDTESVADYISDYGCFMFNFRIPDNFYDIGSDGIVPQPDSYSGENHSIPLIGLTTKNGKKHWIAQNSWGTNWGDNGLCYIPYDWGCDVLAPTVRTTSAITSWTCECYAPWNTRTYRKNSYTPNITSATQYDGGKSINVVWTSDSSNGTYVVFVRAQGDTEWTKKATVTTTSATITLDNYGKYEVMVIGLTKTYYVCSPQSNIVSVIVQEPVIRPENFAWFYPKISGEPFNLTADEWIAFCDRVVAFLGYVNHLNTQIGSNDLGLSPNTTFYEMLEESKKSAKTDSEFTADAFNYARHVIGSIGQVGTGISPKYRGDPIYASYFNKIVETLNLL